MWKDNNPDHICLCSRCVDAIWSRGEKIIKLGSFYYCDEVGLSCEWCEEEFENDQLFDCVFA